MIPSVYILRWKNKETKEWIDENVEYEGWQTFAGGIAVDHRYIEPLVDGMKEGGFKEGVNFEVIW